MDAQEADERYERLLAAVAEVQELLTTYGEVRWARWMAAVHAEVAAGDAHGLTRLRGAFGGMGSLNDLTIHPANGHRVSAEEAVGVNRTLAALLTVVYADAEALRQDL